MSSRSTQGSGSSSSSVSKSSGMNNRAASSTVNTGNPNVSYSNVSYPQDRPTGGGGGGISVSRGTNPHSNVDINNLSKIAKARNYDPQGFKNAFSGGVSGSMAGGLSRDAAVKAEMSGKFSNVNRFARGESFEAQNWKVSRGEGGRTIRAKDYQAYLASKPKTFAPRQPYRTPRRGGGTSVYKSSDYTSLPSDKPYSRPSGKPAITTKDFKGEVKGYKPESVSLLTPIYERADTFDFDKPEGLPDEGLQTYYKEDTYRPTWVQKGVLDAGVLVEEFAPFTYMKEKSEELTLQYRQPPSSLDPSKKTMSPVDIAKLNTWNLYAGLGVAGAGLLRLPETLAKTGVAMGGASMTAGGAVSETVFGGDNFKQELGIGVKGSKEALGQSVTDPIFLATLPSMVIPLPLSKGSPIQLPARISAITPRFVNLQLGGRSRYTGFALESGTNVKPLIGIGEGRLQIGKPTFNQPPDLVFGSQIVTNPIKTYMAREAVFQHAIRKGKPEQLEIYKAFEEPSQYFIDKKFEVKQSFPEILKESHPEFADIILEYVASKAKKGEASEIQLKGSGAQKMQMGEDMGRPLGDIDFRTKLDVNVEAQALLEKLAPRAKEKGIQLKVEDGTINRLDPETGAWYHTVEFKAAQGTKSAESQGAFVDPEYAGFGLKEQKYQRYGDLEIMSLGEQFPRKGASSMVMRETGEFFPELHRAKDVGDFTRLTKFASKQKGKQIFAENLDLAIGKMSPQMRDFAWALETTPFKMPDPPSTFKYLVKPSKPSYVKYFETPSSPIPFKEFTGNPSKVKYKPEPYDPYQGIFGKQKSYYGTRGYSLPKDTLFNYYASPYPKGYKSSQYQPPYKSPYAPPYKPHYQQPYAPPYKPPYKPSYKQPYKQSYKPPYYPEPYAPPYTPPYYPKDKPPFSSIGGIPFMIPSNTGTLPKKGKRVKRKMTGKLSSLFDI